MIGKLGDELHYICTINEANIGLQVAKIAERYKKMMMAQMQRAGEEKGGSETDGNNGSVQMGMNLQKMLENQKAQAEENLKVFGVENVENFTSMRTTKGDLLIMKAHQAAKRVIKGTASGDPGRSDAVASRYSGCRSRRRAVCGRRMGRRIPALSSIYRRG